MAFVSRLVQCKVSHLIRGYFVQSRKATTAIDSEGNEEIEEYSHTPVMVREVIEALNPNDGEIYLDMTFGAGGHSTEILKASNVYLYCLDRDPVAYEKAVAFSKLHSSKVKPMLGRFSEIGKLFSQAEIAKNSLDGVLIDAGCSSMQLDDPIRGFSITKDGPLDMRMDANRFPNYPTAADVLNNLDVYSLSKIFKYYGEEKYAKQISQTLFNARYMLKNITTTNELAEIIFSTIGSDKRTDKLQRPVHVATKVFQALRIFVNNELNELDYGIDVAHSYLKPGGRLVALSFHSLEDRIIKRHFLGIDIDEPVSSSISQKYKNAAIWHTQGELDKVFTDKWKPIYKDVILPTHEEVIANPRSRSAKLRAAVKTNNEKKQ